MLPLLITVAGIHLVALATPGPDFFFVSQISASQTRAAGLKAMLGITVGVFFWAALAILGLDILLQRAAWLQRGIMAAGGLYLCYLAYLLFKSALNKPATIPSHATPEHHQIKYVFLKGVLTNLANPKAIIYFASVFSAFVGGVSNADAKWWILALITIETMLWFSFVAIVFSMPLMQKSYQKSARWIDGCAAALFGSFGLYLLYRSIINGTQKLA
ncbi:MAG: LysE family transporter [Saezia sp.]